MEGYCEKHNLEYELKYIPGKWVFECPQCRAEGLYDTIITNHACDIPFYSEFYCDKKDGCVVCERIFCKGRSGYEKERS